MYDRFPFIAAGTRDECIEGWSRISKAIHSRATPNATIVVECYPGVFLDEVRRELFAALPGVKFVSTTDLLRPAAEIDRMLDPVLGDDPVFGKMNAIELEDFFDPQRLASARDRAAHPSAATVILGPGASLVCEQPDFLVYADMARWEIQMRQRRNEIGNLGSENFSERASLKYKRAFFVDWRAADRLKVRLLPKIDLLLDTNIP
ncbi:MAG: mannose-6-phosphate isomerase, partial [Acidobacteriota bacterium]